MKTLQELKELLSKTTPGPWKSDFCGDVFTEAETEFCPGMDQHIFRTFATTKCGPDRGDAAFIAAAREAVPALIDEVEKLREALDKMSKHNIGNPDQEIVLRNMSREALAKSQEHIK